MRLKAGIGAATFTVLAVLTAAGSSEAAGPPPANFKENPRTCQNTGSFESWLDKFKAEARKDGISARTVGRVLDGMTLDQGVIARDRKQGFFAQGFVSFQKRLATPNRVASSKRKISANKAAFERAEKEFGVPAEVITGFWALESDFGAGMGNLPVLRSLATLAYDCRRGEMFREELKAALKIIDRGDLEPAEMIGSWAGELGQTQFLPTRYFEYAIDYDGDKHPNLFRSDADIIGSTANYMKHLGWRAGEPWIEEVTLSGELPWKEADLAVKHPRSQWVKWGVKARNRAALPADAMPASLLLPMGRNGPAFLAYENFGVYLQWNQSLNYATTAAYLATRVAGAPEMAIGNGNVVELSGDETKELQRLLVARGFDVGNIDGLAGAKTRTAVKEMQIKYKLPADSFPTPELLAILRRGGGA
ncbi:MAG: lytic murein transglycosylase [Hyphomicrobiaceae bacterium]|nr:lytic murein transglycosylase [Hyphomicrobiaceae bacterium]